MGPRVATAALLVCTISTISQGQGTIESRVAAAPDGTVRMSFAARPDVCGDGDCNISTNHHRRFSDDVEWDVECDHGPVRLVLSVRDHTPVALHTYVGGQWRPPRAGAAVTDLGTVSAPQASEYLIGLTRHASSGVASDAIFPATLADSSRGIWPGLVAIARDASRPTHTREQAVFWLGQAAADVSGSLDSIATDDTVDREVREQAVFAISQRPHDESVPILIRIAQSNHDPEVRRKALFWLGQSGDPRAIDLFEKILTR